MHRRASGQGSSWTPYGHEKARRRLLMQRHAWLAIGALALAMFYGVFLSLTMSVETDPGSGGQIDISREEQKPMTVTVSPGRAPGFAESGAQEPDGAEAPGIEREDEGFLMSTLRPFFPVVAPLVGALWLLSRVGASARGKLAEVNFGVYKGAMPYEMHTARRQKMVFTHRLVPDHLFGKTREDFLAGTYLEAPPLSVRRLLGTVDHEEAEVARLRKAGHPRRAAAASPRPAAREAPIVRSPDTGVAPGTWTERLQDAWNEEGLSGLWRAARREHRRRQQLRRRLRRAHELRVAQERERSAEAGEASA